MCTAGLEVDIRIMLKLARPATQVIGCRTLDAEAGDRSQASIREICDGQRGTETGFSPTTPGLPSVGSEECATFIRSFIHPSPIAYNVST